MREAIADLHKIDETRNAEMLEGHLAPSARGFKGVGGGRRAFRLDNNAKRDQRGGVL